MKALTEKEVQVLDAIELVKGLFCGLPYHLAPPNGDEKKEFLSRCDQLQQIVAIRGMLREGGHNVTISDDDKQWIERKEVKQIAS